MPGWQARGSFERLSAAVAARIPVAARVSFHHITSKATLSASSSAVKSRTGERPAAAEQLAFHAFLSATLLS